MVASASDFLPAEGLSLLKSTALAGSGNHVFNARTKWIRLFLVAGGGGGGGGGANVIQNTISNHDIIGGNGGAGGETLVWEGPVSAFGANADYSVGAGGNGAPGRTVTSTSSATAGNVPGFPGGTGGDTVFGALRTKGGAGAFSGVAGVGGGVNAGAASKAEPYTYGDYFISSNSPFATGGGRASAGANPVVSGSGLATINSIRGLFAPGGHGGGGWSATTFALFNASDGGLSLTTLGGVGGIGSIGGDGGAGGDAASANVLLLSPGGGGGGGGASAHTGGTTLVTGRTAGKGGNGSLGGGGGGGGPASGFRSGAGTISATGGAGGNGGNGGIAVFEFG